ncbi:unnamed protein product [Dovyalis caffra]|uniref:non-specific serine/threonine protein kinase n=1 Tax=Dovyalis caffra TaxID=77055 RepID=A0AAV1SUD8_9ROSI|nr:unnamed protein product [Dovyalis caffra]
MELQDQIYYSRYKDDFEEIGKLGKGGFGRVMKCKHKLDDVEYAIKIIKFAENRRDEVVREVLKHAGLHHENIVRYHQARIEECEPKSDDDNKADSVSSNEDSVSFGSDIHGDSLYIQMECCDGTLFEHLFKELGDKDRLWIAKKIVEGLCYIHEKKTIHRDLNTHNIYILKDARERVTKIKIGDFGLAVSWKSDTDTKVQVKSSEGIDYYNAPEVVGTGLIDAKADIFSLGVILFEVLHPSSTNRERIENLIDLKGMKFPDDWKSDQYDHYKSFISKLLSKNPNDRPSAQEVLLQIQQIQDLSPSSELDEPVEGQEKQIQEGVEETRKSDLKNV